MHWCCDHCKCGHILIKRTLLKYKILQLSETPLIPIDCSCIPRDRDGKADLGDGVGLLLMLCCLSKLYEDIKNDNFILLQ